MKKKAEMKAGRSPKLSMPRREGAEDDGEVEPREEGALVSKKTLGSTRVGRATRLPVRGFLS